MARAIAATRGMAGDPRRESRMKYVWPWLGFAALIGAMWRSQVGFSPNVQRRMSIFSPHRLSQRRQLDLVGFCVLARVYG